MEGRIEHSQPRKDHPVCEDLELVKGRSDGCG